MAHSDLDSESKIDSNLDADKELEVSDLKILVKVSKHIEELCLSLKTSLKRISELKRENSKLRQ